MNLILHLFVIFGGGIGGGNTNVQDKQNIDMFFFLIYKLINMCVCSEFYFLTYIYSGEGDFSAEMFEIY